MLSNLFRKKKINYVSDIDKHLNKFRATHKPSASQRAEIKKYKNIMDLRDHPQAEKPDGEIWEEF